MKIAVCLYGLPRGNIRTWNSLIENVITPLSADIYIHTWFPQVDLEFHIPQKNSNFDSLHKYLEYFSSALNVISVMLGKQSKYAEIVIDKMGRKVFYGNQCNMFDSIGFAKSMVARSKEKYDFIIFTRPDLHFFNKFKFETIRGDYFWHAGIFNPLKNSYDFEDTFFIIPGEKIDLIDGLIAFHRSKEPLLQGIQNPILNYFAEQNLIPKSLNFTFGLDFEIKRFYGYTGYLKRLVNIIKRYV